MSISSKASIGVGADFILLGAVSLGIGVGIRSTHIGYIFFGMLFILIGITSILGVTSQKVIRGLRFGLAGVAAVFFCGRISYANTVLPLDLETLRIAMVCQS